MYIISVHVHMPGSFLIKLILGQRRGIQIGYSCMYICQVVSVMIIVGIVNIQHSLSFGMYTNLSQALTKPAAYIQIPYNLASSKTCRN